MTISPFSVIIILILFFYLIKRGISAKSFFSFSFLGWLFSDLFFAVGYFITVSSISLRYSEAFLVMMFLSSIFVFLKNRKRFDWRFFGFFVKISICILLSLFTFFLFSNKEVSMLASDNAFNWDSFMAGGVKMTNISINSNFYFLIIKIIMAFFSISVGISFLTRRKVIRLLLKIDKAYLLLLLYVFIEFIFVYILKSNQLRTISLLVLGNKNLKGTFLDYTGRLYGFFTEPSGLSFSLFIGGLVAIYLAKIKKKTILDCSIRIFIILLTMIISKSFSSVLYFVILLICIYLTIFQKKKRGVAVILIPILAIVVVYIGLNFNNQYFLNRLVKVFNTISTIIANPDKPSNLGFSSETARLYSIYYLTSLFLKFPLFGVGFDTTYSFSAVSCSLGTIGICGTMVLLFAFNYIYKKIFRYNFSPIGFTLFIFCYSLVGQSGTFLLYYLSPILLYFLLQLVSCKESSTISDVFIASSSNLKVQLINA